MHRRSILMFLLTAAALLFLAQVIGIALYEHREIDWFFTPSHFLGGVCVGFAILYMASGLNIRVGVALCLAGVLAVGIAWEIWEYEWLNVPISFDTLSDLVADTLGGYAAYWLTRRGV